MHPRFLTVIVLLAGVIAAATPTSALAKGSKNAHGLEPGEFVVHQQRIPIRVVLIGFDSGQVNEDDLRGWLPATYRPVVRFPQFYGLNGRDLGLEYLFDYQIVHKDHYFENKFFGYLNKIGAEGPPTAYQQLYNDQDKNVLDVTGPVLYINAPAVEKWLYNADGRWHSRGYTIYFVNWYNRSDFRFHVYTKNDDPDPDTGFEFGALDETAMVAWGGTSSRSWFYDFSAGPEWNSVNWLVDIADFTGDDVEDYRMPNIWEYVETGFRSPDALGFDMGLLSRFVAINLLFTSSPLYDPLVTAPDPYGSKVAHLAMFEDDPESSGTEYLSPRFARRMWRMFQPYYYWKVGRNVFDPIDAGSKMALEIFTFNPLARGCWEFFGDPFAQLFCYYDENLSMYVPEYRDRDYVGEVFHFNTTEEQLADQFGLLGYADDNWMDGTQTYSFVFGAQAYRDFGYGFTSTTVHELGHHIGVSHPHDGYDSEFGFDYGPGGFFWFAWLGDESHTIMSYIGLSNDFGDHNTDNMYRWETAGYLNWANALAGDLLDHHPSPLVWVAVWLADAAARNAKHAFNNWEYLRAVASARLAYSILALTAESLGTTSAKLAAARAMLPGDQPVKHVCQPKLLRHFIELRR